MMSSDHSARARWAIRVAASRHVPVYRSSYALILTTGLNAVMGVLFWVAAARLYPTDVVGLGAGGISALQLVATIGWVGLIFTIMRYVPVAGTARRRLVLGVYATGVGMAVAAAALFTATLTGRLNVGFVTDGRASTFAFCAAAAVWVVFTLQDGALISLRRAPWVPVENLLYGTLKLILLVALSAVATPWTLLGAWVGAAAIVALIVNAFLFGRLLGATTDAPGLPSARGIARFSAGHTGAAFIAFVPDFLVPLLILAYLDAGANAYYYAAWSVGLSIRALAVNIADALIVEAAYGQETFARLLRMVGRLFAVLLGPLILVMLVGAAPILRIFGAAYDDEATALLRYFALSLVPFTIVTLALALDRVRERFADALLITSVGTMTAVGLDIILIPRHGITGAGVGWLVGQSLAALVAIRTLRKELPDARLRGRGNRPRDPQLARSPVRMSR
ncbi:MAG: polysaccharide biosynthesis C-terminal domain-containing protein [Chloroflexi bacterium]|nr:polysaccharide biosynthesis C-terminal domain-containing protein [Chloroflexota bacterium]